MLHRNEINIPPIFPGAKTQTFEFEDEIGYGASAMIYCVRNKETNEKFCCKIVPKNSSRSDIDRIKGEASTLKMINHPNITKFIGFTEDEDNFYLIEELCKGKTLFDYINQRIQAFSEFRDFEIKQIMKEIISTLQYLHENNISHRDLKPENIIINLDDLGISIKFIDFGFAKVSNTECLSETYCGSLNYIPPEILRKEPYFSPKVDIWSAGVIFFTLLTGRLPFTGENFNILAQRITHGEYTIPANVPNDARNLLVRMLEVDPKLRIDAVEALADVYLNFQPGPRTRNSMPSLRILKTPSIYSSRSRMKNKRKSNDVFQIPSFNSMHHPSRSSKLITAKPASLLSLQKQSYHRLSSILPPLNDTDAD